MPRAVDPQIRRMALRRYAKDERAVEIAASYGVQVSVIYKWAEVAGLQRNNSPSRWWSESNERRQLDKLAAATPIDHGPVPTIYRCPVCEGLCMGRPWHADCGPGVLPTCSEVYDGTR